MTSSYILRVKTKRCTKDNDIFTWFLKVEFNELYTKQTSHVPAVLRVNLKLDFDGRLSQIIWLPIKIDHLYDSLMVVVNTIDRINAWALSNSPRILHRSTNLKQYAHMFYINVYASVLNYHIKYIWCLSEI